MLQKFVYCKTCKQWNDPRVYENITNDQGWIASVYVIDGKNWNFDVPKNASMSIKNVDQCAKCEKKKES